jgi:hypothetical protein
VKFVKDHTAIFNKSGEHVATIGLNEAYGLWQIVVVEREELEFFCANKEVAFAAWNDEFDPETGFPRSMAGGLPYDGAAPGTSSSN